MPLTDVRKRRNDRMLKELTKIVAWGIVVTVWAVLTLAVTSGCDKAPTGPAPEYRSDALKRAIESGSICFSYFNGVDKHKVECFTLLAGPPPVSGPTLLAPRQRPSGWNCDPTEEITCWSWWDGTEWQIQCDFGDCMPLGDPF